MFKILFFSLQKYTEKFFVKPLTNCFGFGIMAFLSQKMNKCLFFVKIKTENGNIVPF